MFLFMTRLRVPMPLSVCFAFLSFICLSDGSCSFQSTGETLNDCQWSKWCWMCDDCGKAGDSGMVMQLRGTCCEAPNEMPGTCASHCGIQSESDFSMTNFSTCSVACQDKSAPSVCQSQNSGSGPGTTAKPTPTTTAATTTATTSAKVTTAPTTKTTPISTAGLTSPLTTTPHTTVLNTSISVSVYVSDESGSSSGGAIAGGVVCGLLLISGGAGATFYFLVYRKKMALNSTVKPGPDNVTA